MLFICCAVRMLLLCVFGFEVCDFKIANFSVCPTCFVCTLCALHWVFCEALCAVCFMRALRDVCVFSIPLCLRVFPCVCCGDSLSVCCVCGA